MFIYLFYFSIKKTNYNNNRSSVRSSYAKAFWPRAQETTHGRRQTRNESRLQQNIIIRRAKTFDRTRLSHRQTTTPQRVGSWQDFRYPDCRQECCRIGLRTVDWYVDLIRDSTAVASFDTYWTNWRLNPIGILVLVNTTRSFHIDSMFFCMLWMLNGRWKVIFLDLDLETTLYFHFIIVSSFTNIKRFCFWRYLNVMDVKWTLK